jgi:hypothetical protein
LTIFGEKIGVFLKNQCYEQIFAKTSSSLSKNANFSPKRSGENIFLNHNIGPGTLFAYPTKFQSDKSAIFNVDEPWKTFKFGDRATGQPSRKFPLPSGFEPTIFSTTLRQ